MSEANGPRAAPCGAKHGGRWLTSSEHKVARGVTAAERRSEESGPTEGDVKQRVAANVEDVGPRRRTGKVRGIFPAPRERARSPQPGEREEHQEKYQTEQREGDVWIDGGKLARIRNAVVAKEKCPQRRGYAVRENAEVRAGGGDTTRGDD